MTSDSFLLNIQNLKTYFPVKRGVLKRIVGYIKAVDDVSISIKKGEIFGLVGESGCGKTTFGRSILRLVEPTFGNIYFYSKKLAEKKQKYKAVNIIELSNKLLKSVRQEIQIIFQDPYSSLNPRMSIETIIGEPFKIHGVAKGGELEDKVKDLINAVGLNPDQLNRYPHQFSGGQRQRISIARALALNPQFIVADEPVSALDVSIQAQAINLLKDLQKDFGLTYLFISHDLSVLKYISNRIAVMYLGKIVEISETDELFHNPKHPYTEALISAVPIPKPKYRAAQILLEGDVPTPFNPPTGCNFHPRCRYAQKECKNEFPESRNIGNEHFVSCHFSENLKLKPIQS